MSTVLVVGSSGIIGVAGVTAALRSGYKVLAVVRNQESAQKVFKNVGKKEGITIVEADVTSDDGMKQVVDQVKAGKLPPFQHVFATVGSFDMTSPMQDLNMEAFRRTMNVNLEANFLAYKATVPYLIESGGPDATFTLITGGAGEIGIWAVTAISQGALFSLATVACRENANTNVRFNELYLNHRVEYDAVCDEKGTDMRMRASEFGRTYEGILANKDISGCRVTVTSPEDVDKLKYKKKLPDLELTVPADPNKF